MGLLSLGTPESKGSKLLKQLQQDGRFPPVKLRITSLDTGKTFYVSSSDGSPRFLSYDFNSSIIIPVDTFSFSFVVPDSSQPLSEIIKEGDIAELEGNGKIFCVGIIDQVEIETDDRFGERVSLSGRDLLCQFEDQDVVSINSDPIYSNNYTIDQVAAKLIANTKIRGLRKQKTPSGASLFASNPGESKLAALSRYMEPLNCVAWMDPDGYLVIGKPNMAQSPIGTIRVDKQNRFSNVISIKVTRSSTQLPNIIIPIWSGQENVQSRTGKQQAILNNAQGPSRLYKRGYQVPKTVVISSPNGSDPQSLADVETLKRNPGGTNFLQAYAKREVARQNQKEMIVQVVWPGHYDHEGNPFKADTTWNVIYDRGGIDKKMYCYHVEYKLDGGSGQKTIMWLCNLNTIVADNKAVE